MRVPLPAAMTIALLICTISALLQHVCIKPAGKIAKRRMSEIAAEIIHGARHMRHILRLTITPQQAGPETDEAERPFCTKHRIGSAELFFIKPRKLGLCAGDVMGEHGFFAFHRHIASRILKEGDEIIGAIADKCVLVIDQADTGYGLALAKPENVRRMVIAKEKRWHTCINMRPKRRPERVI